MIVLELVRRIAEKIRIDPVTGCWLWTGARTVGGYGVMRDPDRECNTTASRMSYQVFVGPIPEGYEPDHLCRTPACVHPLHLEAVTHRVNLLRGNTVFARNAAKTHCHRGHPYDSVNTHISRQGRRECRACWRIDANNRYYAKGKAL